MQIVGPRQKLTHWCTWSSMQLSVLAFSARQCVCAFWRWRIQITANVSEKSVSLISRAIIDGFSQEPSQTSPLPTPHHTRDTRHKPSSPESGETYSTSTTGSAVHQFGQVQLVHIDVVTARIPGRYDVRASYVERRNRCLAYSCTGVLRVRHRRAPE
jgi:hypothetical protein